MTLCLQAQATGGTKPLTKQHEWDVYFLKLARLVSSKSKDLSTKCGCILVRDKAIVSTGYNGLCSGMDYSEEVNIRPYKYLVWEHAERNSIYLAAKNGTATNDCMAYITGPPCSDCARALIQAGIYRVVWPTKHNFIFRMNDPVWKASCEAALNILAECRVHFEEVNIDEEIK